MSSQDRKTAEAELLESTEELVARYAEREEVIAGLLERSRKLKESLALIRRMFEEAFGTAFGEPLTEVEENINIKT